MVVGCVHCQTQLVYNLVRHREPEEVADCQRDVILQTKHLYWSGGGVLYLLQRHYWCLESCKDPVAVVQPADKVMQAELRSRTKNPSDLLYLPKMVLADRGDFSDMLDCSPLTFESCTQHQRGRWCQLQHRDLGRRSVAFWDKHWSKTKWLLFHKDLVEAVWRHTICAQHTHNSPSLVSQRRRRTGKDGHRVRHRLCKGTGSHCVLQSLMEDPRCMLWTSVVWALKTEPWRHNAVDSKGLRLVRSDLKILRRTGKLNF